MEGLWIESHLSEERMTELVNLVSNHVNCLNPDEVEDIDEVINGVRIYVGFEEQAKRLGLQMNEDTGLPYSELLDKDWEVMQMETAIFTQRIRSVLDSYNQHYESLCRFEKAY